MKRIKYLALAALVAFGACDEGTTTTPAPTPTGTISGVVTVEGVGQSGITVTLSNGSTATTDGSGAYSFSSVEAGAYTVSISGFASDVTFSATAKAATIATSGQVATVNFDGSYVRTSAILGNVSAGGTSLEGVTVSIGSSSTTTDSNGQYAFSGLKAGTYTVTISGFDSSMYTFAATSADVTVGVGESKVQSFSGQLVTTAKITGYLYIDENPKNNTFEATAEDKLAAANVTISLESGVNNVVTVDTDANGMYEFTGLAAGSYRVSIDPADTDIPGNLAFGGTATSEVVTLTTGTTATVNWPFDILQQAVTAAAFYGRDGTAPGINPYKDATIRLYAQEADAVAGTPVLATGKTDETGTVTFRFLRSADTSPGAGGPDNIVFAEIATPLATNVALNGESRIEIKYNPKDSLATAPDTFDVLTSAVKIAMMGYDAAGNPLKGWATSWWRNDTTAARIATGTTTTKGADTLSAVYPIPQLPDTYYVRLAATQPAAAAGGHAFTQEATAGADGAVSLVRTLMVVNNGTSPVIGAADAGTETVMYADMNVTVRVHHEQDDSTDMPVLTGGDSFTRVPLTNVQLYMIDSTGARTSVTGAGTNPVQPAVGGWATWTNVPLGDYEVRFRSVNAAADALNDTTASVTLDGLTQADTLKNLEGNAGVSTFALKMNNTILRGKLQSIDGATPAGGMRVHIMATPDNIQPNKAADTTVTTGAGGVYSVSGLREGPYMVTVMDSTTTTGDVWKFFDTLETTSTPLTSGSADNTDAYNGTRDIQGSGDVKVANFQARRMDTYIKGIVANDRDADFNTLDPEEALPGVTMELIQDLNNDGIIDTDETVATSTTTDANGGYSFGPMREGDHWIVRAVSPANATVLRTLAANGSITNTVGPLTTTAAPGTGATLHQNNTRQVGTMSPPAQNDELPRWNYATNQARPDLGNLGGGTGPNFLNGALTTTPTNFIQLYSTGSVSGTIVDGGGNPAAGVTVNVTLCATAPSVPTSPIGTAAGCTTTHTAPSPWIFNTTTDASGAFTFSGLLEGVYEVNISPATGGYSTLVGFDGIATNGDEVPLFSIVGNNDVETVPAYTVN